MQEISKKAQKKASGQSHPDKPQKEGLRERKQRETRQLIAQTALNLFLQQGYDNTTLDTIAEAAGISRRTFFAYYKSKDDIILAWQTTSWQEMLDELRQVSALLTPLNAVRQIMVAHATRYQSQNMKALDQVMLASETLISRKQAAYAIQEAALFETLCEIWPEQAQSSLRIVAMLSVGAMRLALEAWRRDMDTQTVAACLDETFAQIQSEI